MSDESIDPKTDAEILEMLRAGTHVLSMVRMFTGEHRWMLLTVGDNEPGILSRCAVPPDIWPSQWRDDEKARDVQTALLASLQARAAPALDAFARRTIAAMLKKP